MNSITFYWTWYGIDIENYFFVPNCGKNKHLLLPKQLLFSPGKKIGQLIRMTATTTTTTIEK